MAHRLPDGVLLNVNVPALPREEIRGFRVTEQGQGRFVERFEARVDPRGKEYFWQAGETLIPDHGETIDDTALEEGYVAVTPIHFDLTARPFMAELATWGW